MPDFITNTADFFQVNRGIQIDDAVSVIYTPTASPDTPDCGTAVVGSLCMSRETGSVWKKVTDQGGIGDWVELANKDYATKATGISSTGVILDQVATAAAGQFAWIVTAYEEQTPTNNWSAMLFCTNDGTDVFEPTLVKYSVQSVLMSGAKIPQLDVRINLTGDVGDKYMSLHVSSGVPTTFISYRMVKNLASSKAVVLGGANLDNHIADGSVHVLPYQNDFLDGIASTLKASEVNFLAGATSNIQDQINTKANSAAVTAAMQATAAALAAEISARTAAEATLSSNLSTFTNTAMNNEIIAREQADTTLQDNLNAEIVARANADDQLVPLATKGQIGGVASLDSNGAVPTSQLPPLNYVPLTAVAAAEGVASLNSSGKVPDSQLNTYNSTQIDTKLTAATTSAYHGSPYDIASAIVNKPSGNAKVLRFAAVRVFTIPTNAVGSFFKAGTPATLTAVFSVWKNQTQIGTLTFSPGVGQATCILTATNFDIGDILGIQAPPSQDTSLADIMFTIAAQL